VTVHGSYLRRFEPPDSEEGRELAALFEATLDRFRPDVVMTDGGHPLTLQLLAGAKQRGAAAVFAPRRDVDLDQLPGHLVRQGPGDRFQFREPGAAWEALGIKLSAQLASHLAQAGMEFSPDGSSVLNPLRSPPQMPIKRWGDHRLQAPSSRRTPLKCKPCHAPRPRCRVDRRLRRVDVFD
jgi:hypothetical protein